MTKKEKQELEADKQNLKDEVDLNIIRLWKAPVYKDAFADSDKWTEDDKNIALEIKAKLELYKLIKETLSV